MKRCLPRGSRQTDHNVMKCPCFPCLQELAVTLEEIERQSKAIHAVQADILLYENECLRADGKIREWAQ